MASLLILGSRQLRSELQFCGALRSGDLLLARHSFFIVRLTNTRGGDGWWRSEANATAAWPCPVITVSLWLGRWIRPGPWSQGHSSLGPGPWEGNHGAGDWAETAREVAE